VLPNLAGKSLIGNNFGNPSSFPIQGHIGGEETHTLTVSEMPAHRHQLTDQAYAAFKYVGTGGTQEIPAGSTFVADEIENDGGGGAHNNMPPYLVVVWGIVAN